MCGGGGMYGRGGEMRGCVSRLCFGCVNVGSDHLEELHLFGQLKVWRLSWEWS